MNPPTVQIASEVAAQFKKDLAALLAKYGEGASFPVEIRAEDHYHGYPECGEDIRMTVTIPALYDKDGNPVREWAEIDLGKMFCEFSK